MAAKPFSLESYSASQSSASRQSSPAAQSEQPSPDEDDDLPYPHPLNPADFQEPAFSALAYLAESRPRHQTLEDLRSDLTHRSKQLDDQLNGYISDNYRDFVLLGSGLGDGLGSERLEGVKLGLLGWGREVEGLIGKVEGRRRQVEGLIGKLKACREEQTVGRQLVEVRSRIEALEQALGIAHPVEEDGQEDGDREDLLPQLDLAFSDDESEAADSETQRFANLDDLVYQFEVLGDLMDVLSISDHPFVVSHILRKTAVRFALLEKIGESNAGQEIKSSADDKTNDISSLLGRLQTH